MSNLKLVKAVYPNNYWNTCGKDKEFLPTSPCKDSVPTINDEGRVIQEPKNPWWINSEKDHYCFWKYIHEKSQPDGSMEPLLQSEIADLFGCSSTKVHFMLREAMQNLMKNTHLKELESLLEEEAQQHSAQLNGEVLGDSDFDPESFED